MPPEPCDEIDRINPLYEDEDDYIDLETDGEEESEDGSEEDDDQD